MKTLDVTGNQQRVNEFVHQLEPVREPIRIVLRGRTVARLVPPAELSEAEKETILQAGWRAVQKARARNRGARARALGKVVDAAVRRVRSQP